VRGIALVARDLFVVATVVQYEPSLVFHTRIARRGTMARRPLVRPRKEASQERSRATVDALVQATARILVTEGFDKASTNRIAEVAGVSVGSLYQYFPGKEALVAAVMERHRGDLMRTVRRELAGIAAEPLPQGVRKLIAVAVRAHRLDPRLHRVLAEQIPRVGPLEHVESFDSGNFTLFREYLESRREETGVADLDLATFVAVTSIEALTHNAVLHHPERLSDAAMDALVDEATRMIVSYLAGPPIR
jgi:AcrR family transcriptional regulator